MLKHATPRSSPSLSSCSSSRSPIPEKLSKSIMTKSIGEEIPSSPEPSSSKSVTSSSGYSERSIDCEGIKNISLQTKRHQTSTGLGLFTEKLLSLGNYGSGIGPVITHGRAIVRKGLSFSLKKEDSCEITVKPTIKEQSKIVQKEITINETKRPGNEVKSPSNPSKDDPPSLKSLLRLPGVYGHIPVPESAPQESPHIVSPDSLSLNSGNSFISSNSGRISCRSWNSNTSSISGSTNESSTSNYSSSSELSSQTTLKIYAKCLRSDIEYKTISLGPKMTCRQLIDLLLSKARMRHRDPNLFYLTMEVTVRRWSGMPVRALLVLEDNARPAQLALCRPPGDLRFALQMRKGGVIKVNDTVLTPNSQYKSLLVSYKTTAEEVVQLLLHCCGKRESKHFYALHEVCRTPNYTDRRMDFDEKPLESKREWPKDRKAEYVFVLRRNMSQAFSLRKLAFRTSEFLRQKNGPPENGISRNLKNPLPVTVRSNKTPIEESLIDCTTTIPVLKSIEKINPVTNLLPVTKADAILRSLNIEPNNNTIKMDTKCVKFAETEKNQPELPDSIINKVNVETQTNLNTPSKSILKKKDQPTKLSISVQTEVTCLTINGYRKMKPRWNSVETLIDDTPCLNQNHLKHCNQKCNSCFYI